MEYVGTLIRIRYRLSIRTTSDANSIKHGRLSKVVRLEVTRNDLSGKELWDLLDAIAEAAKSLTDDQIIYRLVLRITDEEEEE